MIDYNIITIDVSAAVADQPVVVGAPKLIVLSDDGDSEFRVEELASDRIPALPTFEMCAEDGEQIDRIYVDSPGGGTATGLRFLVIRSGNANLFAPP